MKRFLNFIQNEEKIEDAKEEIADKVAAQEYEENDDLKNNMETDKKPNEGIIEDIKKEIEEYEKMKVRINNRIKEINKKIEIFSSQNSDSDDEKNNANEKIKSLKDTLKLLDEEIKKFDELISKSEEKIEKLKSK